MNNESVYYSSRQKIALLYFNTEKRVVFVVFLSLFNAIKIYAAKYLFYEFFRCHDSALTDCFSKHSL